MRAPTLLSTLLLVLLLPAVSAAEPACLSADATLDDQRALAAVREDTESACPCTDFSKRGDYRSCAQPIIDAALDAGLLRPECGETAVTDMEQATCGTGKLACGVVRLASKKGKKKVSKKAPVRCELRKASSCGSVDSKKKNKKGKQRSACLEQTHCSDVVEWTAGTCLDPRQDGPEQVGYRTIAFRKDSVTSPGTDRVLEASLWYPTSQSSGPVAFGGFVDASVATDGAPLPWLVFSHGLCGTPQQSVFLMTLLASHGYLVIAPPHPPSVLSAGCLIPANIAIAALERPADAIHMLDEMLALNADPGSEFFELLDPERIGMMGHSFGGFTTYLAVDQDPRFKVAVPLAPGVPLLTNLTIPSLTMLGQADTVVANDPIREAFAAAAPPKYLVEIEKTGHLAFSDLCFPSADCNPPLTTTQDEAHAIVRRWVLPFLEVYLRGDPSRLSFLGDPVPPGVLFEAQP